MAEIIIPGPQGRIEARYTEPPYPGAPIALILVWQRQLRVPPTRPATSNA